MRRCHRGLVATGLRLNIILVRPPADIPCTEPGSMRYKWLGEQASDLVFIISNNRPANDLFFFRLKRVKDLVFKLGRVAFLNFLEEFSGGFCHYLLRVLQPLDYPLNQLGRFRGHCLVDDLGFERDQCRHHQHGMLSRPGALVLEAAVDQMEYHEFQLLRDLDVGSDAFVSRFPY